MELNYVFNGEEFDFEVNTDDLYEFFKNKTKNELLEIIFDNMDESDLFWNFEDDLKDYYEDDALNKYEKNKDPLGYVGMREKDFI